MLFKMSSRQREGTNPLLTSSITIDRCTRTKSKGKNKKMGEIGNMTIKLTVYSDTKSLQDGNGWYCLCAGCITINNMMRVEIGNILSPHGLVNPVLIGERWWAGFFANLQTTVWPLQ